MSRNFSHYLLFVLTVVLLGCFAEPTSNDLSYSSPKTIEELGQFKVQILTEDTSAFYIWSDSSVVKGQVRKEEKNGFNFDGTYCVTINKERYYFKYGWYRQKESHVELIYVNWLKNMPSDVQGTYLFERVEMQLDQKGTQEVCIIGDSQTWWSEGNKYRLLWTKLNENVRFVGSRKDVYGFPHEGEGGDRTIDVLNRIQFIPSSNNYVLLIGTNDVELSPAETVSNIRKITNGLKEINSKANIFVVTVIPCLLENRKARIIEINEMLVQEFKGDRVRIIDVAKEMKEDADWEKRYLKNDRLHLNQKGYVFLVEELNNAMFGNDAG